MGKKINALTSTGVESMTFHPRSVYGGDLITVSERNGNGISQGIQYR